MNAPPFAHALLPLDDAIEIVAARVVPLPAEQVPVEEAGGRFVAQAVPAATDLPPFTNSALDGYAVRADDTPGRLVVVGESAAGMPYEGEVGPGEAARISTGAAIPDGADAIAQIEIVTVTDDGGAIEVSREVGFDEAVRHAGDDIRRGETVLEAGTRIGPAQLGAAISAGVGMLPCGRRPSVALLTTGSELRAPGMPLARGQIYDSNGPMLQLALAHAGATVTRIPAAVDTPEAHRQALAAALDHDVVISSGGVSVGAHDLVREIGRELGVEELLWRISMRPGKPVSFGVRGRTLVFGLPGNPVSTLVGFELFVRPALLALQGSRQPRAEFRRASLATSVRPNSIRDDMIRVKLTPAGTLEPVRGQQSHQIAIAARADALARIPAGTEELPAGTEVAYLPLHSC